MSDDVRFERLLADVLADAAPMRTPDRLVPDIVAAARRARRRPRWLALATERPMRLEAQVAVGSPAMRFAYLVVVPLLLALVAAGTVVVGASLLSNPSPLVPSERGVFTPTGSLTPARGGFTTTLLTDGRVLVVGGASDDVTVVANTDVWDPATGSFSSTAPLAEPRLSHSATLLPDGRVVMVGGRSGTGMGVAPDISLRSAELWDPATGLFSRTGSLASARQAHTATLLADGRVLVIGGHTNTAELWDPATGSFSRTGALAGERAQHQAILLADGRVLVVGGACDGDVCRSAELWDPETGSFDSAPWLPDPRIAETVTLLRDGRVLVIGGNLGGRDQPLATAELWDPATGSFSPAGSLSDTRSGLNATLLLDGRVLVTGGERSDTLGAPVTAEIWDPATRSFTRTGSLGHGRGTSATLLLDGRVLIIGSEGEGPAADSTPAEVYDPFGAASEGTH